MTLFIRHRVNQISDLESVKPEWGVEIDLRSDVGSTGKLHLSHDPWKRGDDFGSWLGAFKAKKIRGPIILNTKEDGLEAAAIDALQKVEIDNYFFLDTALPTLVRLTAGGTNRKFAVRLSSFGGPESVRKFEGLADWVWVDCFGGQPVPASQVEPLKKSFKICLVSPELQGQAVDIVPRFADLARLSDAICTKRPDVWAAL
jgi:hypothetical protein